MAMPILHALAEGRSIEHEMTRDRILTEWRDWARDAKDVGKQTRALLRRLESVPTESEALGVSREMHERAGRSGGNGALMRTGPLALGYLDRDPAELVTAAGLLARLTHWEDDNADACALWCLAIRQAVITGEFDLRAQVEWIPAERRGRWAHLIERPSCPVRTRATSRRGMGGSSPHSKPHSARSADPLHSSTRSNARSAGATPTRSPRSPARLLVPFTAARQCRSGGSGS